MRCYKCNSVLLDMDFCNSCGTNVVVYKKIVKLSNLYYNMGLAKARVRDLSGAADMLQRSIKFDKKNINARNLLGLVYYEMGESAMALKEWVISKNIRSQKNVADDYIREVQTNLNKHEAMSQSIKKFNIALGYANEGNDDMAIIQLKKLLSINHNFVKAHLLLALMYMKKEEYEKAKKEINRVLKIDKCNTLAIRYADEIALIEAKRNEGKKRKKTIQDLKERDALSGNDVIIPDNPYKEINYGLRVFVNVIIGIVLGAALVYFLVIPAKENQVISDYKDSLNTKTEDVAKLNIEVAQLEKQLEAATKEKTDLESELKSSVKSEKTLKAYDKLFAAAKKYIDKDVVGCADSMYSIGKVADTSDAYTKLFNSLKKLAYKEAGNHYYNQGTKAMNAADYETAIKSLKKVETYTPDNTYAMYCLARSYRLKNGDVNDDNAIKYFNKVIEMEPNSDYAEWSKTYLTY